MKFAPSFWPSCASWLCPALMAGGNQLHGISCAPGRQEGAAQVALWLGTAGEMMGHGAEETFCGAGCGQAGDPGSPSVGCTARRLCPQMPTPSSGL